MLTTHIDFRLHVYDTNAPLDPIAPGQQGQNRLRTSLAHDGHETSMKEIKTINAQPGGWTITDSHLSPDNQR